MELNKKLMFWVAAILYCSAALFWFVGRFWIAMLEITAISIIFWFIFPHFQKGSLNLTFLERIQQHLNLQFVDVQIKRAKPKRIIAGFMIPLFPFFARIRYPTKEKIAECIIHELNHIWWFIYGFQLTIFMLLAYALQLLHVSYWLRMVFVVAYLLLQEYLAFSSTARFDKKQNLNLRPSGMNLKTVVKYVLVYGTILYGYLFIFLVVGAKIWFMFDILMFVAVVVAVDRGFWYVFRAIDKIWKTKAL
jgi:hypothetical protein